MRTIRMTRHLLAILAAFSLGLACSSGGGGGGGSDPPTAMLDAENAETVVGAVVVTSLVTEGASCTICFDCLLRRSYSINTPQPALSVSADR